MALWRKLLLSFWIVSSVVRASNKERILTQEQVDFFQREGYLHVSGLLDSTLLHDLALAAAHTVQTAPKFPFFYSVSQSGLMFGSTTTTTVQSQPQEDDTNNNNHHKVQQQHRHAQKNVTAAVTKAYQQAALYSKFPQAVAELMQLHPQQHNLRVLRDVFLAKAVEDPECCDWHVDDLGFWPESFVYSQKGMDGVNVWIALDDMPAEFQGSMAVAARSHSAEWRHRGYLALGQNRSQDGGRTKQEVIHKIQSQRQQTRQNMPKSGKYPTCDIRLADPEIAQVLDASGKVLDLKRGDVIFATRLLFHRTVPVTESGLEYYREQGQKHLSRYSIRYVPGTARLPQGWSVEWSIVDDNSHAGLDLDSVVDHSDKLFYPMVWPTLEHGLKSQLQTMETALPTLSERAQAEYSSTIYGMSTEPASEL